MTKTDWTPEEQPSEGGDPLSATGMFLSALGKESDQPGKQSEPSFAQPAARPDMKLDAWPAEQAAPSAAPPASPASAAASQGSPGEFTRLFQAAQPQRAVPPQAAAVQAPVTQAPAATIEAIPAPAPAPSEFTRIFVKPADPKPADRPPAPVARSIPEPPPASRAASGSPRMKGFSSGASDSASAEGGFTQFFQTRPSAPAPAPAPRAPVFPSSAPPPPPPAEEIKWPPQPDLSSGESAADRGASASSVTGLFASLNAGGQRPEEPRQQPVAPPPAFSPAPTFSPAPPSAPSAEEAGSVTRLIQRLSEGVRTAPPAEELLPPAAAAPPPPVPSTGPGEFTRMIAASQFKAPPPVPPAPAPPPPAPAFTMPAAPPMPAPAAPHLVIPPAPKPAPAAPAFQAPKMELPPAAIPKPAPPAPAAPPGKFQEMVPILLVINTFLLLVLMVLVIFALKTK